MSKSNSSNKKKIAIALMSTLFCAGNGNRNNISAMNTIEKNKTQNPQTLTAVRGAAVRNNQSSKQGLTKNQKLAIVTVVTALVVVSAIGFTILGGKSGPDQQSKNPESGKNEKGYDYVKEVCKRLDGSKYSSMLESFNKAVAKIKSCEFSTEEAEHLAAFLKVVKGEKKVLKRGGVYEPFMFGNNEICVDLDDGMTYRLYFKIGAFEIQKRERSNYSSEVFSLQLSYYQ